MEVLRKEWCTYDYFICPFPMPFLLLIAQYMLFMSSVLCHGVDLFSVKVAIFWTLTINPGIRRLKQ
jgi:hypothetical protein